MPEWMILVLIGLVAGVISGLFGVGGGLIIVPALVIFAGFTQHRATGTSLMVLLPPVGIAAVLEYYRHGNVSLRAGIIIAAALVLGAWAGAFLANKMSGAYLRLSFGAFMLVMSIYMIYGAGKRLGWI
jgi:uncharacterized membrane protein YfcA